MTICINSRDLEPCQCACVETYFREQFSYNGRRLALVWQDDDSNYMILGYQHGSKGSLEVIPVKPDFSSVMFRVHEAALLAIAGRGRLRLMMAG